MYILTSDECKHIIILNYLVFYAIQLVTFTGWTKHQIQQTGYILKERFYFYFNGEIMLFNLFFYVQSTLSKESIQYNKHLNSMAIFLSPYTKKQLKRKVIFKVSLKGFLYYILKCMVSWIELILSYFSPQHWTAKHLPYHYYPNAHWRDVQESLQTWQHGPSRSCAGSASPPERYPRCSSHSQEMMLTSS